MTEVKKTFMLASTDSTIANWLEKIGYKQLPNESVSPPDFIVVPGGSDVNPKLYFQERRAGTIIGAPDLDFKEYTAIIGARLAGIPVVGICRGLQLFHVTCGGTLIQHVSDHSSRSHTVSLDGVELMVNSYHHQAVPPVEAEKFYENYYLSSDGQVTEAVFSEKHKFFGVQWHPEYGGAPEGCRTFFQEKLSELLSGDK